MFLPRPCLTSVGVVCYPRWKASLRTEKVALLLFSQIHTTMRLLEIIMDESFRKHDPQVSAAIIRTLVEHLQRYPQDLIDSKRLLRTFRISPKEFSQALVLIDRKSEAQSSSPDTLNEIR